MSMQEFLTMIFKYKIRIIAIFVTVVAVVTVGVLTSKPVYEAKSILLVKPWKEDAPRPGMGESNGGNTAYLSLSQEELVNTEIQILTGRDLAEKVIGTLKMNTIYPAFAKLAATSASPMDVAISVFEKNLKIAGVRKSNVITVTFQHNDPKIAAAALNLLVDAFKEKHLALHSDPQSSFIGSQLTAFENKLKESERDLQAFQQANKVYSLEEQRSLLLKQRSDLDTSYKISRNNVSELRNKISATKGQLANISKNNARYTPTERDKIVIEAKTRQLELQLKEQDLRRKYSENNRLVIEARKEVDLVSQFLKEQEAGIAGKVKTGNPVYQNIEIDLFRAEGELNSQIARADALSGQLKQLDKEIALLDMSENKIQNLKREIAINEKNYKTYADRQEEARISEAMNMLKMSNISVVQAAVAPVQPVTLNKSFKLVMGILVGIFSGLTFAYMSEMLSQTFSDPESIEKYLELPVLLTVPCKED
jgi:uncharacterized protein involved in exopolysaccharide biosynthesis